MPLDLVDIPPPATRSALGGRPKLKILDDILRKCHRTSEPLKILYRCAGNCGRLYSNRNTSRAVRHATGCHRLPAKVREDAQVYAASKAPSAILLATKDVKEKEIGSEEHANTPGTILVVKRAKIGANSSLPTKKANPVEGLVEEARRAGKVKRHRMLDLAIVKLICSAGLPSHVVDLDEWKEAFITADHTYVPVTRAKLEEEQIIGEAARIRELQIAYLQTQENITVSCDGGTNARKAFWTLHMSTQGPGPLRKVYLMDVREATSERHTAVWIKDFVLEVTTKVGRSRLCAIVCDSTGNTRLHRQLLVDEIPTLLNLPDIVHFISNTIKDIVRIPYFSKTVTVLRGTITKFHGSHSGEAEMIAVHLIYGISKGLDTIGGTRFGTIIIAAWALQLNIPCIREIVVRGKFDLGTLAAYFRGTTRASLEFELVLAQLIELGSPALKALTCLEANEATAGDVYLFWHAMIWAIQEALIKPHSDYPQEVQEQVLGILNSRHKQLFGSGNMATAADLYLSGVYLDPTYLQSDLFEPNPPAMEIQNGFEGIRHVATFKKVARYLLSMAEKEIRHGSKPLLTKWKGHATEFKTTFLEELKRYARHQYPYNQPIDHTRGVITWWQALEGSDLSKILPVLAIKIFSVRVNSMPEERTVSAFTWITPPLRSRLSIGQMAARTQIRQHYSTEKKVCHPRPMFIPSLG
ncbi:hypothetical protein BDN70DRAFT_811256 [Pholiota conissans]|uniref:DUF659 domain-containing protein n=1 Tax=Pholiota conissans TaxID=109636 RepID=A0A9P5YYM1_9AGAR|nr:hypothetical protein BDN70DRAFT_811256 [Pholiota conissans]